MTSGSGNAARRAALTSYGPICNHGRRLEYAGCAECEIEYDVFDRPSVDPDRRAKDLEAGRTGNEPDYEGEDDNAEG